MDDEPTSLPRLIGKLTNQNRLPDATQAMDRKRPVRHATLESSDRDATCLDLLLPTGESEGPRAGSRGIWIAVRIHPSLYF